VRPLLVLAGEADDWTPAAACVRMVAAMRERGADVAVVTYPGAHHYFDVEGQPLAVLPHVENDAAPSGHGATVGYQAAAAADARRRIAAFLARTLRWHERPAPRRRPPRRAQLVPRALRRPARAC
jgi:dienelactone hydrolase